MDISEVLSIAGALQAQKMQQVRLEASLKSARDYMDLQESVVLQLLASIPSASPAGLGGQLDTFA